MDIHVAVIRRIWRLSGSLQCYHKYFKNVKFLFHFDSGAVYGDRLRDIASG